MKQSRGTGTSATTKFQKTLFFVFFGFFFLPSPAQYLTAGQSGTGTSATRNIPLKIKKLKNQKIFYS
jgi:hypothetical protein